MEGVENEKQLGISVDKKIDYVQGYYFSKPLKEEDLIQFLNEKNIQRKPVVYYDILGEKEPRLYKHILESQIISKL